MWQNQSDEEVIKLTTKTFYLTHAHKLTDLIILPRGLCSTLTFVHMACTMEMVSQWREC